MRFKSLFCVAIVSALTLRCGAAEFFVAPTGSDAASGAADQPFRTIQRGIDAAAKPGDTVTVLSGTYREELSVRWHGAAGNPITLRAARKQAAIVDGAERVRGWRAPEGAPNVWTRELGKPGPYNNDNGRWDVPPRSEQVFVDGKRCAPVDEGTAAAAAAAMPDYSFSATRTEPVRYALKLPAGVDPNAAATEVTVAAASLLDLRGENVVIDGLTFRRARQTYQQAMVVLRGDGIEFRNNLCEYSSAGSGLAVQARRCRVHDNVLRANGQYGLSMGGAQNVVEDNLVEGNDLAHYKEWGTGGTKVVGNANVIRRNRFIGNLGGVAIWLDSGPCNNVIEYNYVCGNYGEGIRSEISFHNYIGFNVVEGTRPCTSTMFGRTQTHCIGISVQNSSKTCVVHNLLKDNRGAGIQLATYQRNATDLPQWQERFEDADRRQWLTRSWESGVVLAHDNVFFNNVVLQTTAESAAGPCVYLFGLTNGQKPHCYGNLFDHNFYWNSVTRAPQVRVRDVTEVPGGRSEWQTRYGMDVHALGGFAAEDYRQAPFAADYPYPPTRTFAGLGKGKDLKGLSWQPETDYAGAPLGGEGGRPPSIGHIGAAAAAAAGRE
jgi:hypothetical protein